MTTNQPIAIPYENGDDLVHLLPERPWCSDATCPCRQDADLLEQYLYTPINDGLLTVDEAVQLYWNRQVGA